ncbi:hypothetical protein [Ornithobacterium rhinotracheale]|uniref:hypothetical protein n=2 Tax=Ornithobacterium rhinotracheale TaxID=28251 RepID=UPI004035E576
MTQREKRKIKFWLFIFLVIFILFWFTEKKSIKEKITTGDGSVIPLDLEKLKAPAPILPKVDKPKFDSVFAKGGSAVRNEKAFNQKVENMMQAEKQKGKIPVKSDVVKKLQEEQKNEEEKPCTDCGAGLKPLDLPPKRVGEFGAGDIELPRNNISEGPKVKDLPSMEIPRSTTPSELEGIFNRGELSVNNHEEFKQTPPNPFEEFLRDYERMRK